MFLGGIAFERLLLSGMKEFKQIGKIEEHHRDRYKRCLEMLTDGTVFKREKPIKWKCAKCGFTYEGTEPPPKCPACKHPKEYYEPANMDI